AVAELSHPNIVPLYDYGVVGSSFYCAMSFIEGLSLETLLRGRLSPAPLRQVGLEGLLEPDPAPEEVSESAPSRPLPLRFCIETVRDVALALDHAHRRG